MDLKDVARLHPWGNRLFHWASSIFHQYALSPSWPFSIQWSLHAFRKQKSQWFPLPGTGNRPCWPHGGSFSYRRVWIMTASHALRLSHLGCFENPTQMLQFDCRRSGKSHSWRSTLASRNSFRAGIFSKSCRSSQLGRSSRYNLAAWVSLPLLSVRREMSRSCYHSTMWR